MISPQLFADHLASPYREMLAPARQHNVLIRLHSDGHITELVDEILNTGVNILNLQDLCNGVENIRRTVKGRACIDLCVDAQKTLPFGSPAEIRELIEEEVRTLGSPEGGLMLQLLFYPPTPPENIDAALTAVEELRTYWS
jgi:hypothetical protein